MRKTRLLKQRRIEKLNNKQRMKKQKKKQNKKNTIAEIEKHENAEEIDRAK